MTAVVRQLRRTRIEAASTPPSTEPVDYCRCGRGPVVGYASCTESRVTFLAFSERWASADENVADWRCLDCVADMVADVASGRERERRRRVCGDREDLRRSEVRAQAQRSEMAVIENAPQEGDCLT